MAGTSQNPPGSGVLGRRILGTPGRGGDAKRHQLLRCTSALLTQIPQIAVCSRHHTVDKQLCRWLLLSLHRLTSNALSVPARLITNMLAELLEGSPRPPESCRVPC